LQRSVTVGLWRTQAAARISLGMHHSGRGTRCADLKKLMPRRNEQPGPVPILNPAEQPAHGQAADGTVAAADAPDNPSAAGHELYTTVDAW
jgi:hypothetical protein